MDSGGAAFIPEWENLPALPPREVHIYSVHVNRDTTLAIRARQLLSREELDRAAGFRVAGAAVEFAVGRAALRVLLGHALHCAPEAVDLQRDLFGKPFVPGIHCNVSHSRGLIYLALCRDRQVGIDVEWIDPSLEALDIAEGNFAPDEIRRIAAHSAGWERARMFCQLWARKEAVAKANGKGLQIPLRNISVPDTTAGPAWVTGTGKPDQHNSGDAVEFFVQDIRAPHGFAAALAILGDVLSTKFMEAPLPFNIGPV